MGMGPRVRVKKNTIRRNLVRLSKSAPKVGDDPLMKQGRRLIEIAAGFTPILTGELVESRFVNTPVIVTGGKKVVVGYTADHAPIVHERTELSHPIGRAKFLQAALDVHRSAYLGGLGAGVTAKIRALRFR